MFAVPLPSQVATLLKGDITPSRVEGLEALVHDLLLPLFSNDGNAQEWPEVVKTDLVNKISTLKNQSKIIIGQMSGKTQLPLPEHGGDQAEESSGVQREKELLALETAVVDWSHQVNDVLKHDSAQPLIDGQNVGPLIELDFWTNKMKNLDCINDQLMSTAVQNIKQLLLEERSSYTPVLEKAMDDVRAALVECQDITLWLEPMRGLFEECEETEFEKLGSSYEQIIHLCKIIFMKSEYYNQPRQMVVLLAEITNTFIHLIHTHIEPTSWFNLEPLEAEPKVVESLALIAAMHATFDEARKEINCGSHPVKWNFDKSLIFGRLDALHLRLDDYKKISKIRIDYEKLEKVELSDPVQSKRVHAIWASYNEMYALWAKKSVEDHPDHYDMLEPTEKQFDVDFNAYSSSVLDYDLQLGALAHLAFADQLSLEGQFKLIHVWQALLQHREVLYDQTRDNYTCMIEWFSSELDLCKVLRDDSLVDPLLTKNMPPIAGRLAANDITRARLTHLHDQFKQLLPEVDEFNTEYANRVYDKYREMMKVQESQDQKDFMEWANQVGGKSDVNLKLPLLLRDCETRLLSINFDPQLVAVLREVKYLEFHRTEAAGMLPEEAGAIYARNEVFRQYLGNLGIAVHEYNKVQTTLLDVEAPLIVRELAALDVEIEIAVSELNWNSEGVSEYATKLKDLAVDISARLQTSKDNIKQITKVLDEWCETPMLLREEKSDLVQHHTRAKKLKNMFAKVEAGGLDFYQLLKDNAKLFRADPKSDIWYSYVEYMDGLVMDGLFNVIFTSMSYFLDNMDSEAKTKPNGTRVTPFLHGKVELQPPDATFIPGVSELDEGKGPMLLDWLNDFSSDFFRIGELIPRLAQHIERENYRADLETTEDLKHLNEELQYKVKLVNSKAMDFQDSNFNEYQHLWTDDRDDFMRQFLLYNHVLTNEEIDLHAEENPDDPFPECPPTLEQFKENIDKFNALADKVLQISDTVVFDQWYELDVRPFRSALHTIVTKWSFMFIKELTDNINDTVHELGAFIKHSDSELSAEMEEGSYDQLVLKMSALNSIKSREKEIDSIYEPVKAKVALLEQYAVEIPDEILAQLDAIPNDWAQVKKLSERITSEVAPAQADEVVTLKTHSTRFDIRNFEFREDFNKRAPTRFDATDEYARLDKHWSEYSVMDEEMQGLEDKAALFLVRLPEFKQVRLCAKELKLLKILWDTINSVRFQFSEWSDTPFSQVDIEGMDQDCKKMIKDIRGLNKDTRAWEAYSGVDAEVKNMVTSLGAVGLLQSSAIRKRHWDQVMQATGIEIPMGEDTVASSTTLKDLLALQLHEYEEEVASIVDRAGKELQMEKMLSELEVVWKDFNFEFDVHKRRGLPQVKVAEDMVEVLEDNQVQLQNLLASKYIGFFQTQVASWSTKLSNTDQVLEIWQEVQRTWSNLESIFIGSEDIRAQLPEDAKRFDGIDADYIEVSNRCSKINNVVDCTNQPNLFDQFESMQDRLALCEKALQEYLDTKRLAFPRFYFVSSADLLDILSNGNNPAVVAKQLSKLFAVVCNLKFISEDSKDAVGMISSDGEYVEFGGEKGKGTVTCDCDGRVEEWLMNVLIMMQETIRWECHFSFAAYEEKPRSEWVFDNCAQVTLVGTQVWWAVEVNIAFGRLEEGYENAMKEYVKKHIGFLNELITLLQGTLSKANRVMLQTTCTVDVHSRDVVFSLINQKAENAGSFLWVSQLRHRWNDDDHHTHINICDAKFIYSCEYLGNIPRLVITPLTDRCYITLTQSLHLMMSGAPAGPAGTGKTETTKDLSRNIGIMIYVFNCSEQMDYKSTGNIYKGLSQSGAWGCFDEFNRISIEVLSVVAVQVKTVQDAIKAKKKVFNFMGETIKLNTRVGIWITMNPGYAGRTALPENIKALFRPCAMVVPDYGMICEIMLVSEGFLSAKLLGRKFITLYSLNRDLLSKQDHYDWGLRAIKSVLVVAGKLKRADPDRSEEEVLMRALRDFNIPKIVNEDLSVFMGLIVDLFPGMDVPRNADVEFEKTIVQAITDRKLQPEEAFVLKVVQMEELLEVRHSVFIIGLAATGKSCVLRALFDVYRLQGQKPVWTDLNPKACTNHELYGFINMTTREWVDGLFSSLMRDVANIDNPHNKWIVLDGDIDTMWIESLNTTMDDNKILTLASNERIPLNPTMRLVFEIGNLSYASPATVSRAGILFVNPTDLGWNPCVQTWIDQLESPGQRASLMILFEKYVPTLLDAMKIRFKTITPIPEWTLVNTLCTMLGLMLTEENTPEGCGREDYELYFVFCCIWAFGGSLFKDQLVDWREEFSKWWVVEFKTVKFPAKGTVYDYYIRAEDRKWMPWADKVPTFTYDPEAPVSSVMVHTAETTRLKFWMDLMVEKGTPLLFVGAPGMGKTALCNDTLGRLSEDSWLVSKSAFNHYSIHHTIQASLELPLEKKAGKNYGPPGTKRLVYFVDDMNMPAVDLYGTQSAHTIMRQVCDYNHWYDRVKKQVKIVSKTQFMGCMNPKAGSFTINPRLLRHFAIFALSAPNDEALTTIYSQIWKGHVKDQGFPNAVNKITDKLVTAAVKLHSKVASTYLPTAIKFHYLFNLRDLSNVFQGLTFSSASVYKSPLQMVRLFSHEATRVYSDKMTDLELDVASFAVHRDAVVKEAFGDLEWDKVSEEPNLQCHFAQGVGDPLYAPVKSWEDLQGIMSEALTSYNEVNAAMNLVLFQDAMRHVCRINRILENPRGNALLVGVGGSGKQSLSRLSASISGLDTFQISLTKGYGIPQLKEDLAACFVKAGQKGVGVMFLMTDSQVADEKFLVLLNDLLSTGEIQGLFADDEKMEIIDGVRNEVKGLGLEDTNPNCWNFFLGRVRQLLKVVLCFSPVGDLLRTRARMFPSLVNCTSIDWFHDWPEEALVSVSRNFLEDNELVDAKYKQNMAKFMAYVHLAVNDQSKVYLKNEKRYNYTTPKSFLEQIDLYQNLLKAQVDKLQFAMDRMENGLTKLNATAAQVDDMKSKLAAQEIVLAEKNEAANALIERVGIETEKVNKEKAVAKIEQDKVAVINTEVSAKAKSCSADLAKAEPALEAAQAALNTLNKNNLTELKSFGSPPEICVTVAGGVMVLMAKGKIQKDRSWKACKIMMGNVGQFLDDLINYDKENIPAANLKEAKKYIATEGFNAENVAGKSQAAAGLCAWVVNIVMFYEVFCDVAPKRLALQQAETQLKNAQDKLAKIMAQIDKLDAALKVLTDEFQEATNNKLEAEASAAATAKTISLANRLVGGLASEKVRWGQTVAGAEDRTQDYSW